MEQLIKWVNSREQSPLPWRVPYEQLNQYIASGYIIHQHDDYFIIEKISSHKIVISESMSMVKDIIEIAIKMCDKQCQFNATAYRHTLVDKAAVLTGKLDVINGNKIRRRY